MALKEVSYICYGCRVVHKVRIKVDAMPRRTYIKTCPHCHKYRRHHIWAHKPITRKDVL